MNTKLFYKSTLRKISFHYAGPAWLAACACASPGSAARPANAATAPASLPAAPANVPLLRIPDPRLQPKKVRLDLV